MSEQPIFDCGRQPPMRTRSFRVADENGHVEQRVERRPRGIGVLMLDTQGNTIWLRLTNAMSERSSDDPWGRHMISTKCRANAQWGTEPMIPYLSCPQQTEYEFRMPDHLKTGRRCSRAADGKPIGEDTDGAGLHPCECMLRLQAERRAKSEAIEKARDPKTSLQEAILANAQGTTAEITKTNAAMTALLKQILEKESKEQQHKPEVKR